VKTHVLALLIAVLCAAVPARGQGAPPVEVELELFGAGGVVRPGDWAGVRLALRDTGAEVRAVRVALELPDADGDTARWEREVTLNPGGPQGVWLYARLPFTMRSGDPVRVSVRDDGGEIASSVVATQTVIDAEAALVGLVGRAAAGLDRYRVPSEPGATTPATGHEWIEFAILDPDQLGASVPDAWTGLTAMKTIVWTEGRADALRAAGADAIAEWVRRGGHLVIVVPADGGGWTSPGGALAPLLPDVEFVRREGVDLGAYRPLLTSSETAPLPDGAILHELRVRDASDATPILVGPGGAPVVVRRQSGAGAVTLVGIDVTQRDVSAWLDPQRFWHRVLGERFDVLSSARLDELRRADPPANFRNRTRVWLDDAIEPLISKTGRAGVGVLLGFVVFSLYWLVAGPGGFALLKWTKQAKHSWVVFVGVSAVFTAIAWGGAAALRPVRTDATHLTFVDQVHGQDEIRARSWIGVLLPRYGETPIGVEPSPGLRHALAPWDAPGATRDSFPDPRVYSIDARRAEGASFPSRATVKQVRLDWLGAPPWGSIEPRGRLALSEEGKLSGTLEHALPGMLEDVTIMLVLRQQAYRELPSGALQARTLAWRLGSGWEAGETLDLGALGGMGLRTDQGDVYLNRLSERAPRWAGLLATDDRRTAFDKLELLTWGPMIGPPAYRLMPTGQLPAQVSSRVGHGLDLARWFTQPCVIVTGRFASESPAPLVVDGRTPPSSGVTMLRWVYPLPASPPEPVEDRP